MNSITYRNSSKKGSKADPRFTLDADGMATYGDGDKARPCIEMATPDGRTIRMVPPKNVYIPGGANVETVSFDIGNPTVTVATVAAAAPDAASAEGPSLDMAVVGALVASEEALVAYIATTIGAKPKAAQAMAAGFIKSHAK